MKREVLHISVQIQLKEYSPSPIPARSIENRGPLLLLFQLTDGMEAFLLAWLCLVLVA